MYFVNVLRLSCTTRRCLGALRHLLMTTLYVLYSLEPTLTVQICVPNVFKATPFISSLNFSIFLIASFRHTINRLYFFVLFFIACINSTKLYSLLSFMFVILNTMLNRSNLHHKSRLRHALHFTRILTEWRISLCKICTISATTFAKYSASFCASHATSMAQQSKKYT